MKTDNELIAEFMEVGKSFNTDYDYFIPNVGHCNVGDLKYHKRWDWLMPVVDKIWKVATDDNSKTHVAGKAIKMISEKVSIFSSIEEVYKAVVEFIKWYNTNGK